MNDRIFRISLIMSFIIHIVFIRHMSAAEMKKLKSPVKQMEVVYHNLKSQPKVKKVSDDTYQDVKLIKKKEKAQPNVELLSDVKSSFASLGDHQLKDISKIKEQFHIKKKTFTPELPIAQGKRHITVPLIKNEKITNPKYLSYRNAIRQKILNQVYKYINHPDFAEGQVYISFILKSNGYLKAVRVVPEKTKANIGVQRIALKSINDISYNFPPLPSDLKYPELPFNIEIVFRIKE